MSDPSMQPPALSPKNNASAGAAVAAGPPEEEFWERYNKRLEFPLSTVSAVLIHVLVGAVIIFVLVRLMGKDDDRSGVPVKLATISGLDDAGSGSQGSGGNEETIVNRDGERMKTDITSLMDPSELPKARVEVQQTIKYLDPSGKLPITDANAAAYASLNESMRNKLIGSKQGAGKGEGSGYDGSAGKGPGGTGADSTLGRSMRWVLRFKVTSGRDYVSQLKAMEAKILVPMPNSDSFMYFPDLNNLSVNRIASEADMQMLRNLQQFSDSRRDAVQGVSGALGLDFRPQTFWAFFPKTVEEELARKETSFRNRRSEDIEETVFRVTVVGGNYTIVVDEQRIKK